MGDVTQILAAIDQGDQRASERLLPLVYEELRRLAAHRLAQERPGDTLRPTALVHEAYLRLVSAHGIEWNGRGHFFAAAAEAMRRILVNRARDKRRLKRGGGYLRLELSELHMANVMESDEELLALHDALTKLEAVQCEGTRDGFFDARCLTFSNGKLATPSDFLAGLGGAAAVRLTRTTEDFFGLFILFLRGDVISSPF